MCQLRLEHLISTLGQEMAMLTDILSSSKDNSFNLCAKVAVKKCLLFIIHQIVCSDNSLLVSVLL